MSRTLPRVLQEENLLALHPTVKPVALVADAILDFAADYLTVDDLPKSDEEP